MTGIAHSPCAFKVSGWYTVVYSTITTTDGFQYTCETRIDTVSPNQSSSSSSSSSGNKWYQWNSGSSQSSSSQSSNAWSQWKSSTSSESSNVWSQLKSSSNESWSQLKSNFNRNSSAYMIAVSAVGVVGFLTAFFVRKRRMQVARIDLDHEEGAAGTFEMMSNGGVQA